METKTNVQEFQEEEILKCMTSKYFKIIIQEKFPKVKKISVQIEKGPLKTFHAQSMKKGLF